MNWGTYTTLTTIASILGFSSHAYVAPVLGAVDPVAAVGLVTAVAAVVGAFLAYFQSQNKNQGDRGIQAVQAGITSLEAALERADVEVGALRTSLGQARQELLLLRLEVEDLRHQIREKDTVIAFLRGAQP
jgi:uncharacterized protein HemX